MNIIVFNNETNEGLFEIEGLRKNLKQSTILEKVKQHIFYKYNIRVTRLLPTGKIDFATGKNDIHYIVFGENANALPTRDIRVITR